MTFRIIVIALVALAGLHAASCAPTVPNELDKLGTVPVTVKERSFQLWIADDPLEQERGLMFITSEQMADLPDGTRRGMLFVFDHESVRSFWMKNTIIPLDIAYLDTDGIIVATHTMAPLDDRHGQYSSRLPARYVIEVNAGVWQELNVREGDLIEIPASALKGTP